jgi:hypothetical protein
MPAKFTSLKPKVIADDSARAEKIQKLLAPPSSQYSWVLFSDDGELSLYPMRAFRGPKAKAITVKTMVEGYALMAILRGIVATRFWSAKTKKLALALIASIEHDEPGIYDS